MSEMQDHFDNARRIYSGIIAKLNIFTALGLADPDEQERLLIRYDWILQACLLRSAICDGKLDRQEREFIEEITDYGDLLVCLKEKTHGKLRLSWRVLEQLDSETRLQLQTLTESLLDDTAADFAASLASADASIGGMDLLKDTACSVGEIGDCLARIDGRSEEREARSLTEGVEHFLLDKWQSLTD